MKAKIYIITISWKNSNDKTRIFMEEKFLNEIIIKLPLFEIYMITVEEYRNEGVNR